MANVLEINDKQVFENEINSDVPVLVDFACNDIFQAWISRGYLHFEIFFVWLGFFIC